MKKFITFRAFIISDNLDYVRCQTEHRTIRNITNFKQKSYSYYKQISRFYLAAMLSCCTNCTKKNNTLGKQGCVNCRPLICSKIAILEPVFDGRANCAVNVRL